MIEDLGGQVAIVTGSSKGIGRACAQALAAEGVAVVVGGRTPGEEPGSVGATVNQIREAGGKAVGVLADVRLEDDVERMIAAAVDGFGRLDIVVNNAGVYHQQAVADMDVALWDEIVATNLRGTFLTCRAALPHLIRGGGGSIVNITSRAGEPGLASPGRAGYAASKAGVDRFTQVLAEEVRAHNVAVNALSPVGLLTEGSIRMRSLPPPFPRPRVFTPAPPEAIGPPLVYLARQRADFTGKIVRRTDFIDGEFGAVRP
jgi:NAD(P)-dependent dehydrogenase (short-subunit alcohol dehydrogenase family)